MTKARSCTTSFRNIITSVLLGLLWMSLAIPARADSIYSVTVDTASLNGVSAQLALDLIAGGSFSNSVLITGFLTDGALGTVTPSGGVSGNLPGTVTLTDSSFFNEYLTGITLGNAFSFLVDATTNAPSVGSFPDAFSFSLLDPTTGLPLFSTSDPTGADTLLSLNIDGSAKGVESPYSAPGGEAAVTSNLVAPQVPEPSSLLLILGGLTFLMYRRRARS